MPDIPTSPGIDEVVVGFEDETEKITEKLLRGCDDLDVVSITGMAGLGKTTLARKVYYHKPVIDWFHLRAWCCVSQEYDKNRVFHEIYSQVLDEKSEDDSEEVMLEILSKKCRDDQSWDDLVETLYADMKGKLKSCSTIESLYESLTQIFAQMKKYDIQREEKDKILTQMEKEDIKRERDEKEKERRKILNALRESISNSLRESILGKSRDRVSNALRQSIIEKCESSKKWDDIAKPLYQSLIENREDNNVGGKDIKMWEDIARMIDQSKIVDRKDIKKGAEEVRNVFKSLIDLSEELFKNITEMSPENDNWRHMLETLLRSLNDVVESLLINLNKKCRDSWDDNIAEKLRKRLLWKRYLIVLDDVWKTEAWDELSRALPDGSEGSRVILTSREYKVGKYARGGGEPHSLRFFKPEESFDLLKLRLSKDKVSLPELNEFGRKIAEKCGGVPLVVILVAGILQKQLEQAEFSWENFLERLSSHIRGDESRSMDVIDLSYKHLPPHLKPCLLYFGAFPEDHEIPVSNLIQLWMAEGFIKKTEKPRLEDEAEDYLNHLIGSNLVMVSTRGYDGSIRTCRVHDLIGSFSLIKSKKKKFLMQTDSETGLHPEWTSAYDRFCLLKRESKDLSLDSPMPLNPSLETLVCFSSHIPNLGIYSNIDPYSGSWVAAIFESVKVLDLESIVVGKSFLSEIASLRCLRYLAVCLSGWGSISTPPLARLVHLETFKVKSGPGLHLPFMIWNLQSLRHLHIDHYCPTCPIYRYYYIDLPKQPLNLQTFSIPVLFNSTAEESLLRKLRHLRRLRCRFGTSWYRNRNRFPDLRFLEKLESLEVCYTKDHLNAPVPCVFSFPESLKQLTLHKFRLPWDCISDIATLPQLESLELFSAFDGEEWDVEEGNFLKLRFLRLCDSRIAKWNANSETFPVLERLVVAKCWRLEELPTDFQDSNTLRAIEIDQCNRSVADSANRIRKYMEEELGIEDITVRILNSDLELGKWYL